MVCCPLLGRETMCSKVKKKQNKLNQTKNEKTKKPTKKQRQNPDSCLLCVKHTCTSEKCKPFFVFRANNILRPICGVSYKGVSAGRRAFRVSGRLKVELLFTPWWKNGLSQPWVLLSWGQEPGEHSVCKQLLLWIVSSFEI